MKMMMDIKSKSSIIWPIRKGMLTNTFIAYILAVSHLLSPNLLAIVAMNILFSILYKPMPLE